MNWLFAIVVAAPCAHGALEGVEPARQAAACAFLAQPPPGPSAVDRSALEAIYLEPGFERARQRDSGALAALWRRLVERLEELFETSSAASYSGVTRVVVLGLGVAASLLLLARVTRRRRRGGRAALSRPVATSRASDDPQARLRAASALLVSAPRDAMREGLLALLAWLEQTGLGGLGGRQRVKTNREIVLALPRQSAPEELRGALAGLLGRYDRAFYSLAAVSTDDARRFVEEVTALVTRPLERSR